jgi:uncharacterized protein
MNPILLTTPNITLTEKDCDCACADVPSFVSHENTKKGLFVENKENYLVNLSDNYRLLFNPYAPNGLSVTNKEGWQRYQSFAEKPQILEQPFDHQLAAQNLLVPLNSDVSFVSNSSPILSAWLHITNTCNLACAYCYIRKSSEKMTEEIGLKAIQNLVNTAKTKDFKILKLKYAGGEPTLDFKLVQKLHCYAIELCKENNLELQAVLLSNGTLINEQWTTWLIENQIKLMLSIDGINEIHDLQRPTKNKTSSFVALKKDCKISYYREE